MPCVRRNGLSTGLAALLAALLAPCCLAAPTYTLTKILPSTNPPFRATALSADGTVIVGADPSGTIGYRWTSATGLQRINGTPALPNFWPTATSTDGSVITGFINPVGETNEHAFRWSAQGGGFDLQANSPAYSTTIANATNTDGSVIVGRFNLSHAFSWTPASGLQPLGALPGSRNSYSEAYGISQDGSVIVGVSDDSSGSYRAVAWTSGQIHQLVAFPFGASVATVVTMTSAGPIIAGYDGQHAVRWTPTGVENLDPMALFPAAYPTGVSADGAVIVGTLGSMYKFNGILYGGTGFIWTPTTGMVSLRTYLGIDTPLNDVVGVSADGATIVGNDWILHLTPVPEPCSAIILLTGIGILAFTRCFRRHR